MSHGPTLRKSSVLKHQWHHLKYEDCREWSITVQELSQIFSTRTKPLLKLKHGSKSSNWTASIIEPVAAYFDPVQDIRLSLSSGPATSLICIPMAIQSQSAATTRHSYRSAITQLLRLRRELISTLPGLSHTTSQFGTGEVQEIQENAYCGMPASQLLRQCASKRQREKTWTTSQPN